MQLVMRGKVHQVDDSGEFQKLQISFGEGNARNKVSRIQNFGFTSHPPKNSEALCLFLGGNPDLPIALACDHAGKRVTGLKEGESAMYNASDSKIELKQGGKITISNGTLDLICVLTDLADQVSQITTSPSGGLILNQAPLMQIAQKLRTFQS
jgi:phage baseplate assembly protein V